MKNLVSDVTFKPDTSFIITVKPENAEEMKNAIRIRVPQLKIGGDTEEEDSWVTGKLNTGETGETELTFTTSITETEKTTPLLLVSNNPASEKIDVYIKLANKVAAGKYDTKLNFNWNTAKITPNDNGKMQGEFEGFDLGSYLGNLGSGAAFKKILAYFRIDIPNSLTGFAVKINNLTPVAGTPFTPKPESVEDGSEITTEWFAGIDTYDFTGILNEETSIAYTITPPTSAVITNDSNAKTKSITATLAVLLPMAFEFTPNDDNKITINGKDNTHLQIKFQGMDKFLGSGEDGGGNDSVMGEIDKQLGEGGLKSLRIKLADIRNEVTSPIFLAVNTDKAANKWELAKIANDTEDQSFEMKAESLGSIPPVKFLLEKKEGEEKGSFYIKSQPTGDSQSAAFDVKISVVADVKVDKSIDL